MRALLSQRELRSRTNRFPNRQAAATNGVAGGKRNVCTAWITNTHLKLRLIRIDLGTEEPEVLITSLMDTATYPHALFKKLYHDRWPVEKSYKLFKSRIELENFTGKSVEAVKQDFYARIFMLNLTSILAFPVQDHIDTNHKDCKYSYQISWTQALAKMKNVGILLFIRETIAPIIIKPLKLFLWSVVPIRPGRKFPRKSRFN